MINSQCILDTRCLVSHSRLLDLTHLCLPSCILHFGFVSEVRWGRHQSQFCFLWHNPQQYSPLTPWGVEQGREGGYAHVHWGRDERWTVPTPGRGWAGRGWGTTQDIWPLCVMANFTGWVPAEILASMKATYSKSPHLPSFPQGSVVLQHLVVAWCSLFPVSRLRWSP